MSDKYARLLKFVKLLNEGKNETFADLIAQNLEAELLGQPKKMLKMCELYMKTLFTSQSEFTRTYSNRVVLQKMLSVAHSFRGEMMEQQVSKLERKTRKGDLEAFLEDSLFYFDLQNPEVCQKLRDKLEVMEGHQILNYKSLIQDYQSLLSGETIEVGEGKAASRAEEVRYLQEAVGGPMGKLSDLIDEKFYEEFFDEQSTSNNEEARRNSKQNLQPLADFLKEKVQKKQLFSTNYLSNKRQKTGQQEGRKILILSPLFALYLQFSNQLLDLHWSVRQSCALGLNAIFSESESKIPFSYAVVEVYEDKIEEETKEEPPSQVSIIKQEEPELKVLQNDVFLKALIFTFKDNFDDYSDNKNSTPTRQYSVWLLRLLFPKIYDGDLFIRSLPNIFRDAEDHGKWQTTYNFFLICKAVVVTDAVENRFFEVFRKVLVEAFKVLEENNKILIAQLIVKILPKFLQDKEMLPELLSNLQNNLVEADDIDQSPTELFNLYALLLENQGQKSNQVDLSLFNFNLQAFFPFNFHKFTHIRLSYLKIVNKILLLWKPDDLEAKKKAYEQLLVLTCQSLIMEREKPIIKQLKINLELILRECEEKVIKEMLQKVIEWVFTNRLNSFETFQFYENASFLSIDGDYYQIITRPVTPQEVEADRYGRIHNSSHIFSMFISKLPDLQDHVLTKLFDKVEHQKGKPILHHEGWLTILKTFYLSTKQPEIEPNEQIKQVIDSLLEVEENNINILYYTDFKPFIDSYKLFSKSAKTHNALLPDELKEDSVKFDALFKEIKESGGKGDITGLRQVHDRIIEKVSDLAYKLGPVYDHASAMQDQFYVFFKYADNVTQRVRALCAASNINLLVFHGKQIEKKNPLLQPVLASIKTESNVVLQKVSCKALADFMIHLSVKGGQESKLAEKVLKNTTQQLEKLSHTYDKTVFRGNTLFYSSLQQKCTNQNYSFLDLGNQYFKKYIQQDNQRSQPHFYACTFILQKSFEVVGKEKCELVFGPIIDQVIQNCFNFINQEGGEDREVSYQLLHKIFFLIPSKAPKIILQLAKSLEIKTSARRAFMVLEHILNISSARDILLPPLQENEIEEESKLKDFWLTQASKVGLEGSEKELKQVLKYLTVFVIPVIRNLSRSAEIFEGDKKRVISILARVLQLLPFNLASIEQVESELEDQAREGHKFLQTFVKGAMHQEYQLDHVKVNCQLRRYQLEGISWMATLSSYNLNFALCDDMGLGKTVQTLCLLLNESAKRNKDQDRRVCNLVVCPTTLTHNWRLEVDKFFPSEDLTTQVYEYGLKQEIQGQLRRGELDLLIVSYDRVRSQEFQAIVDKHRFHFLVLDEGHLIKNPKAKTTETCKRIQSDRRIVLSGTPIQNKVSELWSIFDFLMPNFLEEEKVFNQRYNQYLSTNIKKLSEKIEETQTFVNALNSLKNRIKPFIMRRTKEEVLKDLPPKIIQDYPCEMPEIQRDFYKLTLEVRHPIGNQEERGLQREKGTQIMQSMILHRQACNHPWFVSERFAETDPSMAEIYKKRVTDYRQSGKLIGLVNLLQESEIIPEESEEKKPSDFKKPAPKKSGKAVAKQDEPAGETDSLGTLAFGSQEIAQNIQKDQKRKALIFCQMKSFLHLIEKEVLQRFGVKYLTLTGDLQPRERVETVHKFNTSDSIQVLLLTTSVGGLGLNLTGADTVIFAEHDWNPMKDAQAIDRAHRLGQTRTVNVYRLITQETIEETIMNLQRFKTFLHHSLIDQKDMATSESGNEMNQILQSLEQHTSVAETGMNAAQKERKNGNKKMTQKEIMREVEEQNALQELVNTASGDFKLEQL